jgi:type I restriction enzyme S subunit
MFENLDWNEVTLESVADEITVGYVGPMASEYVTSGIPFLRSTNIRPYKIDLQDVIYIGETFHNRIRKSALFPGDVVIVRTGKPGTAAVIPDNLPISNCSDMVIVKPGRSLDSRFLAYYVNSIAQGHIAAYIVGAVQQHFNVGSAKQLKLHLPPLPEQRAIARILGALDDKIELNRRMNHMLEAMAQALFKSWFVDFDPVTAKAEGRAPFGMSAETAALFPAEFVDSELGAIPNGWRVGTINDLALKIESGGTPTRGKDDYWLNGTIAWFKTGELFDAPLIDSEEKITQVGIDNSSAKLWQPGTILFALYASPTLGRMGILEILATANQACAALNAKPEFGTQFLFSMLIESREDLQRVAVGAAQQNINQKILKEHCVIIPDSQIAKKFHETVKSFYHQRASNEKQSRTLASIRDALLPRLLSGDVRVKV